MGMKLDQMATIDLLISILESVPSENEDLIKDVYSELRRRLPTMTAEEILKTFFVVSRDEPSLVTPLEILGHLRIVTNEDIGDNIDEWMEWFSQNVTDDAEKKIIESLYRMHKSRSKAMKKLNR